jgi:hypothetical protein
MILPFDYIGYKRLSENKRFPSYRWYIDATWEENGWMFSIDTGGPLVSMSSIKLGLLKENDK